MKTGVKTSYKNKKKDRAPIQSNSWIVKNHDVPNNSRYRFAAIKNKNEWNYGFRSVEGFIASNTVSWGMVKLTDNYN